MVIDFKTLELSTLSHFNGGEKELQAYIHKDDKNKLLYGTLVPGASIGLHTHNTSSEVIYFLHGTGKMIYDETEEIVREGLCHYCPKGHTHSLINVGNEDLVFFAVVPEQ